jgi:hypothetical protein
VRKNWLYLYYGGVLVAMAAGWWIAELFNQTMK